jgi:hypothetical protein
VCVCVCVSGNQSQGVMNAGLVMHSPTEVNPHCMNIPFKETVTGLRRDLSVVLQNVQEN